MSVLVPDASPLIVLISCSSYLTSPDMTVLECFSKLLVYYLTSSRCIADGRYSCFHVSFPGVSMWFRGLFPGDIRPKSSSPSSRDSPNPNSRDWSRNLPSPTFTSFQVACQRYVSDVNPLRDLSSCNCDTQADEHNDTGSTSSGVPGPAPVVNRSITDLIRAARWGHQPPFDPTLRVGGVSS